MNFRYKIYKESDLGIHTAYRVEIQIYRPDKLIKHWRHFSCTSLEELCLQHYSNTSIETMENFFNNNDITHIMTKFIKDQLKLQEKQNTEYNKTKEFENKILTKHWKQINIEE